MRQELEDAETLLRRQLAELDREYHKKAQPIVERLAQLEAMKPPRPIVYFTGMDGILHRLGGPDVD